MWGSLRLVPINMRSQVDMQPWECEAYVAIAARTAYERDNIALSIITVGATRRIYPDI
jgi:hypothetical protein